MKTYIGTKFINAEPQTCQKDTHLSKVGDAGYKVEYEDGYISWSPAVVFEEAYRAVEGVSFGLAFEAMRKGMGARLPHWKHDVVIRAQFPDDNSKMTAPYLYVESDNGKVPWKETNPELFSDSWQITE